MSVRRLSRAISIILLLIAAAVSASGCGQPQERKVSTVPHQLKGAVYQVSTINALLQGVYDGEVTCGELKKRGDFGIGTFEGLDGEMVAVDGRILQVKADGKASPAGDEVKAPFATFTFFTAGQQETLRDVDSYPQLQKQLDGMSTNPNLFYAFRIDGTFSYVKARSVPKQARPYPPLAEVTKNQPTFELQNIKGTLVGFWCPRFVEGINVPGYHLHFINEDRTQGGHLLECRLQDGTVQVDQLTDFRMMLPSGSDFARADLSGDRQKELEKVEK